MPGRDQGGWVDASTSDHHERDDPASRLKEALVACDERGASVPGATPAGEVLRSALETETTAGAMALLLALLVQVQAGIRALDSSYRAQAYLSGIGPIETWLGNLNLRERWDDHPGLEPLALAALDTCSDQLSRARRRRRVEPQELNAWRDDAESLLAEVVSSYPVSGPSEFHDFLIVSLRQMIDAIENYRVTGGTWLSDIAFQSVGRFAVERPAPATDQDLTLYARFMRLCAAVVAGAGAIAAAGSVPGNLLESAEHFVSAVHETAELPAGPIELSPPGGQ